MKRLNQSQMVEGLIFFAGAVYLLSYSYTIYQEKDGILSPALFPALCGILLAALSIFLFLQGWRNTDKSTEEEQKKEGAAWRTLWGVLLITLFYLILLGRISFLWLTFFYVCLLIGILGEKRFGWIVGTGTLTVVGIYFIFVVLLRVILP